MLKKGRIRRRKKEEGKKDGSAVELMTTDSYHLYMTLAKLW